MSTGCKSASLAMLITETNTLQVTLPRGRGPDVDLRDATEALQRFGDVSHVKVVPDAESAVLSVVFFDVRSATAARIALGDEWSRPLQQTGSRMVSMPDSMQLGVENLRNVSNIKSDPEDDNALSVEFYDIRDAQRVRDLVCKMAPSSRLARMRADIELPPGLAPISGCGFVPPEQGSSSREEDEARRASADIDAARLEKADIAQSESGRARRGQTRRKSSSDEAVLAQFFTTAAGKKLLSEEYGFEYGSSSYAATFYWEAASDSSDSEVVAPPRSSIHRKGRSTISDASTADSNSEASDQDVF